MCLPLQAVDPPPPRSLALKTSNEVTIRAAAWSPTLPALCTELEAVDSVQHIVCEGRTQAGSPYWGKTS